MKTVTMCTGKLHRIKVTQARLDYEGSITLDPILMEAAGIIPYQLVHINNMSNAVHWETYAIPGSPHSGEVCLNGCPARLFQPGDEVIILSLEQMTREEAKGLTPRVILVDKDNHVITS
jgi:aspartate 1-decarboxylase